MITKVSELLKYSCKNFCLPLYHVNKVLVCSDETLRKGNKNNNYLCLSEEGNLNAGHEIHFYGCTIWRIMKEASNLIGVYSCIPEL